MRFPNPLGKEDLDWMGRIIGDFPDAIGGMDGLSWGTDVSGRAQGYQFGLVVRFRDAAAAEAYQVHPRHQDLVQWIRARGGQVLAFDFPTPEHAGPR